MATVAEEEAILRHRVLTHTASLRGEAPIRKLLKSFLLYMHELQSGNLESADVACKALLLTITAVEGQARRLEGGCSANEREQQVYVQRQVELERAIRATEEEIAKLKYDLVEARAIRSNNEEYEKLRHEVVVYPSRAATLQDIERVTDQISASNADTVRAVQSKEWRKKQFTLLLDQIEELTRILDEDEFGAPLDLTEATAETMEE